MTWPVIICAQIRSKHYQVPSAEYSSYVNHVISLGLAGNYIAQMRGNCSSKSLSPEPPSIKPADTVSGVVDDLQLVPVSRPWC